MKSLIFVCHIEKDADRYFGYCLNLKEVLVEGSTVDETKMHLRNAINVHLETMLKNNIPIPQDLFVSADTVREKSKKSFLSEGVEYHETGKLSFSFA